MRTKERHHLKQNDFANSVARLVTTAQEQRQRAMTIGIALVVIVAIVGGYLWFAKHKRDEAGAALASATAVADSQIAPAPTVPGTKQAAGTYPTVKARQEASLQAFQAVATNYGRTPEGVAALYQSAGVLVSLGRLPEAEKAYQDVIAKAPSNSLYATMARLGLAETLAAEKQYDRAIKEYTDLSGQRDSLVPIDGVLMQLARTYVKAGKPQDARAAFKRVVDEFPDSNYVSEARQEITAISGT
jgi:TolA-binding protein